MKDSRHIVKIYLISCMLAFWSLGFAQATETCSFQPINLPGNLISSAQGINDAGAVVGVLTMNPHDTEHGFLFYQGKISLFMFPGSVVTEAHDINNHAQIVGVYHDPILPKELHHGFLVHSGGFQTIDVPGAVNGTEANGINNFGDIVGDFADSAGHTHGFLLHDGHFAVFSFPGAVNTRASGINDHALIVGTYDNGDPNNPISHGFKVKNGVFATVDFPGAASTALTKVNSAGKMVGFYSMCCGPHGFSLVNGTFTTIDDLEPNANGTEIYGLNNLDQVVGDFINPNSFDPGAGLAVQASCQKVF